MRIGLISDTHGLLRPAALHALAGSDRIVHAGDIGGPDILAALERIAPVIAVRGNNDRAAWACDIPETAVTGADGVSIYVIHDLAQLDVDPDAAGHRVIVSGHSHQPRHEVRDGIHFINPGSAGPRRFRLPITVGRLEITGGEVAVELLTLEQKD
jgi:putative phosphoesterase